MKNAIPMVELSKKVFGSKLTYFMLNKTAGSVFSAGQNIEEATTAPSSQTLIPSARETRKKF